jgi:hypothetical protein
MTRLALTIALLLTAQAQASRQIARYSKLLRRVVA